MQRIYCNILALAFKQSVRNKNSSIYLSLELSKNKSINSLKRVKLIKSKSHFGLVENVFQISMRLSLMHFSLLLFFS